MSWTAFAWASVALGVRLDSGRNGLSHKICDAEHRIIPHNYSPGGGQQRASVSGLARWRRPSRIGAHVVAVRT